MAAAAAALPGLDTTPAHRLNMDVGDWRDRVTVHRTNGCTCTTTQAAGP